VGKFLDHLFHQVFVDAVKTAAGISAAGGAAENVGAVDLPANVGGAVQRFARDRRLREVFGGAVVEAERILIGAFAPAAAAGFLLAGDSFPEQDLVAVGRGGAYDTFIEDPAADVAAFAEFGGLGKSGEHVEPVAGFLDDGDLAAAIDDGDLGRVDVGRKVDLRGAHHHAALGGGKSERRGEKQRCDQEIMPESHDQ